MDSLNSAASYLPHLYHLFPLLQQSHFCVPGYRREEPTSALIQSGCYTGTPLVHTHLLTQSFKGWKSGADTQDFEVMYAWGTCTASSSVVGVTGYVCVIFIGKLSISNFSQTLELMNGSELLLGYGTEKWWGSTHPLVPAPCHLMARLQIHRLFKFYFSASTILDPRDRKVCLNYLRLQLVSTEVFLLAYFEVFCHTC